MSSIAEVGHALDVAARAGCGQTAVLHCVSAYPAPPAAQNLKAIQTLSDAFGLPTGLSDHGSGLTSAIASVALGACLYERHLVLENDTDAIDRAVSSTPSELRAIVLAMEQARLAMGSGVKVCQPAEAVNVTASRRGLYATRTIRAGERVTARDVAVLRPMNEIAPSQVPQLLGAMLERDIEAGEPFLASDLASARESDARRIA
jgi:sialic acid synthase SpsE